MSVLYDDEGPLVYPVCPTPGCETAYVLRRGLSLIDGGYKWLWQRDCKHRLSSRPAITMKRGEEE